jgi:hypothetical protein
MYAYQTPQTERTLHLKPFTLPQSSPLLLETNSGLSGLDVEWIQWMSHFYTSSPFCFSPWPLDISFIHSDLLTYLFKTLKCSLMVVDLSAIFHTSLSPAPVPRDQLRPTFSSLFQSPVYFSSFSFSEWIKRKKRKGKDLPLSFFSFVHWLLVSPELFRFISLSLSSQRSLPFFFSSFLPGSEENSDVVMYMESNYVKKKGE